MAAMSRMTKPATPPSITLPALPERPSHPGFLTPGQKLAQKTSPERPRRYRCSYDPAMMHWRFQLAQRLSRSLFPVPAACVIAAALLAELSTLADGAFGSSLPPQLASTVESARALLAAVATATLTVAFVTLSVTLLTIQLASSQFSPRALHGFFRDPVTKWVTGLALGTFT